MTVYCPRCGGLATPCALYAKSMYRWKCTDCIHLSTWSQEQEVQRLRYLLPRLRIACAFSGRLTPDGRDLWTVLEFVSRDLEARRGR